MAKNDTKQKVLARLTMNNSIPMRAAEFKAVLGIEPRVLRIAVRELRMDGIKVCSGDDGYWLWNGEDDSWRRTKARIRSQAKREQELLAAMDRTPLEGQETWLRV